MREQEAQARKRERLEGELEVARLIQQNFLPKQLPDLPGWQVAAYYRPASEVGGDFYDFIELPDGQVGLVVGDVTDKGMPAAMVMAATRSVLRAAAQRLVNPGEGPRTERTGSDRPGPRLQPGRCPSRAAPFRFVPQRRPDWEPHVRSPFGAPSGARKPVSLSQIRCRSAVLLFGRRTAAVRPLELDEPRKIAALQLRPDGDALLAQWITSFFVNSL